MLGTAEGRGICCSSGNFDAGDRTGNLVFQLKTCSSSRDLQQGKKIHAEAVRFGRDESDIYVASALLNMYCKCASVRDAEVVFQGIAQHNVVTWTTMVYGYCENRQGRFALEYFFKLQEEGCRVNARALVAGIKACSSIAKEETEIEERDRKSALLRTGIGIHCRARSSGMDLGIFAANALVDMYANCGSMALAREVFDGIEVPDAVSWTSLMMGYAENGESKLALELFDKMQRFCAPSCRSFVAALKACANLAAKDSRSFAALEIGMVLHSQAAASGFETDVFIANTLVDLYGKCGAMIDARKVFDGIVRHTVVSWTALMLGYVENSEPEAALDLFAGMIRSGCEPDSRSFVAATKACTGLSERKVVALEIGMFFHAEAVRRGFQSRLMLANAQIDMYVKCGSLVDARKVFETMKFRDLVSWTELMLGYIDCDRPEVALDLFAELLARDDRTCSSLDGPVLVAALKACTSLSEDEQGTVVDGKLVKLRALERAMAVHSLATKSSRLQCDDFAFVANSLVDLYAKCGSMPDAGKVFFSIGSELRGAVAWTVLIQGYVAAGDGVAALEMFHQMKSTGIDLDAKAYVAGLKACEAVADVIAAKRLHCEMCRLGMETEQALSTCLVSCYAKCGGLVYAELIFDWVSSRSVVTWNALLAGYGHQGETVRVLELWKKMIDEGVARDALSYLSVLTACSHAGLVDECRKKFEEMQRDPGVKPRIEHYHCMIDMLGRSGEIDDAVAMVRQMPHRTNEVTWRAVLGACARSKNVELAKVAFESLEKCTDVSGGGYMLMASTVQS